MPEQPPKSPIKPHIDDSLLDAPEIPQRHRKQGTESADDGKGAFVGIDSETGLPVHIDDETAHNEQPQGFTDADFTEFKAEFGDPFEPDDVETDGFVSDVEFRDIQRTRLHASATELAAATGKAAKQEVLKKFRGFVIEGRNGREYTIGDQLGFGMFGAVLEATGPDGEIVAVKISTPFDRSEMYIDPAPESQVEQDANEVKATAIKALLTEVAALQRLMKLGDANPAPKLHDAKFVPLPGSAQRLPNTPDTRVAVVIMDKVIGQDLFTIEKQFRNGELQADKVEVVLQVFLDAAKDLQAIHQAGIIHSDIKPRNMMADLSNPTAPTSQFIDYGGVFIPQLFKQQRSNDQLRSEPDTPQKPTYAVPNAQVGSEGFISQWESPSKPRDIYALGRSIQYMLFSGKDYKDIDAMNRARSKMNETEGQLSALAEQMTQAEKGLRPKLSYVIAALEKLLSKHQAKKLEATIHQVS